MKAIIEIELIGDNVHQQLKAYKNMFNMIAPGLWGKDKTESLGWCAEIIGTHPIYKYDRKFLRYNKDYSRANSKGSRGVFAAFTLDENRVYEVFERVSWKNSERYFCKVEDWKIKIITEEEVIQWLKYLGE